MTQRLLLLIVLGLGGCSPTEQSGTDQNLTQNQQKRKEPLRIPSIIEDTHSEPTPVNQAITTQLMPLPKYWQNALRQLSSSPVYTQIAFRRRSQQAGLNLDSQVEITWLTEPSTLRETQIANVLELPNTKQAITEKWVNWKDRTWRFLRDEENGTTQLIWRRRPTFDGQSSRRCARPHHISEVQLMSPSVNRVFRKMSTKRVIELSEEITRSKRRTSVLVWYKNGFAQDEHVGQIQSVLKSDKWLKEDGQSVKQFWYNTAGDEFSWQPVRESFSMGCELRGPLISFIWSRSR